MARFSRKQILIISAIAASVALIILLIMFLTTRCVPKLITEMTSTASAVIVDPSDIPGTEPDALVFEDSDVDQKQNLNQLTDPAVLGDPSCPSPITILISDKPGRPGFPIDIITPEVTTIPPEVEPIPENSAPIPDVSQPIPEPSVIQPVTPAFTIPLATPTPSIILPILPPTPSFIIPIATPTPLPVTWITFTSPVSGNRLTAGTSFTLEWSVDDIGRTPKFDVQLSEDGGSTYNLLAKDLTETTYTFTLPSTPAEQCIFRIDIFVSSSHLGYGLSPAFSIIAPTPTPTPSPTPTPTPSPTPTPTPSPSPTPTAIPASPPVYIPADNAFISSEGNATRWFSIEHDLSNVASTIWQISTQPFSCDTDSLPEIIPGLIATGKMDAGTTEFSVDFASLLSRYEIVDGMKPSEILPNQGSEFEPVPEKVLLPQSRRVLYLRLIALDENEKPVATPGSGIQIIYGEPELDLGFQEIAGIPVEKSLIIECPKEPGADYETLTDKGFAVWAPSADYWPLSLDNVPPDSVEIDLQLSSVPFESKSASDFSEPDGLIYRSKATGLVYTTVTRYYHWNFSDFAPSADSIGDSTVRYYLRAVCLVPDGPSGSLRPVISETIPIYYTGDMMVFTVISYDPPDPEPEEVVVESNAPYTYLQRYITTQWPIYKSDQYFEVTRPIQAEEMCFSITNNKTGDFLLPYSLHKQLYPQTTRESYQATLDAMLPVGAWFHLTLTESTWSNLWDDFVELAKQTYSGIQSAYNGIKSEVAVFIADRFTFLGEDARNLIEKAVTKLIDVGLASIGLPPSLPDFEAMAGEGLDYCLKVALAETSAAAGVPIDEIPIEVQNQVTNEVKNRIESLAEMNRINPLNVDFLKPASEAAYRPAYIDVRVYNQHGVSSPTGTLTVSFYPVRAPHYNFYEYVTLPVPSLKPGDETIIRVYLKPDNTDSGTTYKSYYYGEEGDCLLTVRVKFDVPDIHDAAMAQGVSGSDPNRPDVYVFDYDPVYEFLAKMPPGENIYPANQYYPEENE